YRTGAIQSLATSCAAIQPGSPSRLWALSCCGYLLTASIGACLALGYLLMSSVPSIPSASSWRVPSSPPTSIPAFERQRVLDAIDELVREGMLDPCGGDFYALTEKR